MNSLRVHLKIHGRVQGVFFRAHTQKEARLKGLTGWVRNCSDGSVEAVAEGPSERVEEFIQWCHQGPPRAQVSRVDVEKTSSTGEFQDFEVRYF